jgi:hypothetical protein
LPEKSAANSAYPIQNRFYRCFENSQTLKIPGLDFSKEPESAIWKFPPPSIKHGKDIEDSQGVGKGRENFDYLRLSGIPEGREFPLFP